MLEDGADRFSNQDMSCLCQGAQFGNLSRLSCAGLHIYYTHNLFCYFSLLFYQLHFATSLDPNALQRMSLNP